MVTSCKLGAGSSIITAPPPIIAVQVDKESVSFQTNRNTSVTSNPTSHLESDVTFMIKGNLLGAESWKRERESKKAQMIKWASKSTLKDAVLIKDGIDVETLWVWKWSDLKYYMKQAFLQTNNISKAQAKRTPTEERMMQMKLITRSTNIKLSRPLQRSSLPPPSLT